MFRNNFKGVILTVLVGGLFFFSFGGDTIAMKKNYDYYKMEKKYDYTDMKNDLKWGIKDLFKCRMADDVDENISKVEYDDEKKSEEKKDNFEKYILDENSEKKLTMKKVSARQVIPVSKEQYDVLTNDGNDFYSKDFRNSEDIVYIKKEKKKEKISDESFKDNKIEYNRIYVDLDGLEEIMKEVIDEKKTEKEKLEAFYLSLNELFEIFKSNFLEIIKVNSLYKNRDTTENCENKINDFTIKSIINDGKKVFRDLKISKIKKDSSGTYDYDDLSFDDFVLKYIKSHSPGYDVICNLYKKVIFDIDTVNSYLGMRITTMLQCLKVMDDMYGELVAFTENMKDKGLLNLKFIDLRKLEKCSEEEAIDEEHTLKLSRSAQFSASNIVKSYSYFFDQKYIMEKLTSYLKQILESLNLPKKKFEDISSYYLDFIDRFTKKIVINSSDLSNIKKVIELMKEIMPVIEKITQEVVYENIINKVMGFVGEEDEYVNKAKLLNYK